MPSYHSPRIKDQRLSCLRISAAPRSLVLHGPFPEPRDHHVFASFQSSFDYFQEFLNEFRCLIPHEAAIFCAISALVNVMSYRLAMHQNSTMSLNESRIA